MTVRILLVRHGRVDFGSTEFRTTSLGRRWDPPLDPVGRKQAASLTARLLLMQEPVEILVSPFARCRQTIDGYLRATGAPSRTVEDIGEVFIGEWEGVRFEDVIAGDEELARRFREQDAMFSLSPGGESGPQLRARVVPAIEEAVERALDATRRRGEDQTLLVITHGGVINAYLGHVLGVPRDMFFLPDNASINTVVADEGDRSMRFLNDVRHLTDPAVFAPPAPGG